MRVALNGTAYDALSSGARDRFLNLYGAVARLRPDDEFTLYSPRDLALGDLFAGPAAADVRTPFSPSRTLTRFLRSRGWFARRLGRDGTDLFVTDHFPVLGAGRPGTLLTVHDLRYLTLDHAGSVARRLYFRARFARLAARALAVVTVSETMRREIHEHLALDPARVHVVPNGVEEPGDRAGDEAVASVLASRGLARGYLLSIGVFEPRKNLEVLLRAVARDDRRELPPLVLAGRGGPEERPLRRLASTLGIEDRVRFLGYVPERELPALHAGAGALLVPSRYEGFGLPVLQAFAAGTPVACASAGSLPEVAGDAALLLDPDDAEAWLDTMRSLLGDTGLRSRLVDAGRERAREYSWSAAADRFSSVLDRYAR